MTSSSSSSFQIKQDDKFFSRLLSKEKSVAANPSFRVYYGGLSGSVPFTWESQPGTPKHHTLLFSDSSLPPPLTPPPSYYSNANSNSKPTKKHSRSGLLHALFPKLKKPGCGGEVSSPSSSSFSSSSSSSSSSMFLAMSPRKYQKRNRLSTPGSSFDSGLAEDDESAAIGSPTSTLCFAISRGKQPRGCYGAY